MTLFGTLKTIKKAEVLLVTPKVIDFLDAHPDGVVWDEEAYEMWHWLTQKAMGNDDRSGRFGASSRGDCKRLQIFNFIGMPVQKVMSPEQANLYNDGKWRHLRWQMMAWQAGAVTHLEHPYALKSLRVSGSMDGLNSYDSWGWELKGDRNWSRALHETPEKHNLQMHTMMLATGWDTFSYVIEDKESQEWREIIVRRDKKIIAQVRDELEDLNDYVEDHKLPPVLPACAAKEGPYRSCPFAKQCLRRANEFGNYWPTERDWDS